MVITRNISLTPLDESVKKETYQKLDEWGYLSWKLANDVYSRLYSLQMEAMLICNNDPTKKIGEVRKELIASRMRYNTGKASPVDMSYVAGILKEERYSGIHSQIAGTLCQRVLREFKADQKNGLFKGNSSVRNYRREGMNVHFPVGMLKKGKDGEPIPGWGRQSRIIKEGDSYILQMQGRLKFKLVFGRDKSNNKSIVDNILNGNYKFCDSYLKKSTKKKIYELFLCVDIPEKENKLDPKISVGVDLGISNPAVCALSTGPERQYIGNGKDIIQFRFQMLKRRKTLQRDLTFAKGGKGRKKKLKALDRIKTQESNWAKTLNHKISKDIVSFAIKNNAGVIKLELLDGFGSEHKENFVLKNWTYFQLNSMVEYKAKRAGIEVVKIDPYHTSKTCSFCGKVFEKMDVKVRRVECECGESWERDYNAARNIAKSDKVVSKKEECIFYKNKNQKVS